MRGLLGRLVLSHLFVAVVGAAATFLLVRLLAPQMFDQEMQAMGGGMGRGLGLREQFASAVDSALLVGVVVGVLAAGALGAVAAYRLTRPLAALAATTRRLAAGEYAVAVPAPGTAELDDLADSVRALARALHETELRRTRLLGEVTHEMRTPLTVLDGFLEGMIDGVVPADPPTLAQLSAETRRLRRLADDLSALSRAEEGRIELHVVEADLTAVVKAAAERLRPQAEDAGVQLRTPGGPSVRAWIDPDRIGQVVTNLVGNALRATPAGGRVEVDVQRHGAEGIVQVSDTGVGLAAEDLERIFERFYRAPRRSAATGETGETGETVEAGETGEAAADTGSGIGLTIARRLAEAHGGRLTADSAGPGEGAVFTLTLPLRG